MDLAKKILKLFDPNVGCVITKKETTIVPETYVHDKCTSYLFERIMYRQLITIEKGEVDPGAFLLIDNYGIDLDKDPHCEEDICELLLNNRAFSLTYISTQKLR
jgi:hypothetical protein